MKAIYSCITSLLRSEDQLFDPVGWSRRSELASIGTSGSCVRGSQPSVIQQLWLVQVKRAQIVLDLSMSGPWAASSQLLVQFLLLVPEFPPRCGKGELKTKQWRAADDNDSQRVNVQSERREMSH